MLNGETANEFDARVEKLWRTLDASNRGYLDLSGLKKGLDKMDHRMCFSEMHQDRTDIRIQPSSTPIICCKTF